jgi:hypothetical protein
MSEDRLIIEKAIISDPEKLLVFEIENIITDIEIFEHIDKPYLTGLVSFLDTAGIYDKIKFRGVESFYLALRYPEDETATVNRNFIISGIVDAAKNNDKSELITFQMVEESAFISTFLNVNKAYEGSGREIIEKIFLDHFDEYSLSDADETEQEATLKVVVPNMTPMEACNWIKDRTTDFFGSPFYLFSTLGNYNKVHFLSLSKMLNQSGGNTEYVYSQNATGTQNREAKKYIIQNYQTQAAPNISKIISKGLVGAEYSFWDTTNANPKPMIYDVINQFALTSNLEPESFVFNTNYAYKNQKLNRIKSRKIYNIASSYSYKNHQSFREPGSWNNNVNARALRHIITSNAIDISVPGRNFLVADSNKTLGNIIRLRFLNNDIGDDGTDISQSTDQMKSGKHLIYAARHIIRKERYDVTFSCVKLENTK